MKKYEADIQEAAVNFATERAFNDFLNTPDGKEMATSADPAIGPKVVKKKAEIKQEILDDPDRIKRAIVAYGQHLTDEHMGGSAKKHVGREL